MKPWSRKRASALRHAGFYHTQKHRYSQALDAFRQATELNPRDAEAWAGLGWACSDPGEAIAAHRGDEKAAQEHFQAALGLWETAWHVKVQSSCGLLENKALALLGLGWSQEALETLRRALEAREPGETVGMDERYHPPGLEEMVTLLEAAVKESGVSQVSGDGHL